MTNEFLTESQLFEMARTLSKGFTQVQIASELEVTQSAVSQMLAGKPSMIGLAIRWVELTLPLTDWEIEKESDKPVKYYKGNGI
jgi:transcriptional regulator with XRE-family HTH domain